MFCLESNFSRHRLRFTSVSAIASVGASAPQRCPQDTRTPVNIRKETLRNAFEFQRLYTVYSEPLRGCLSKN